MISKKELLQEMDHIAKNETSMSCAWDTLKAWTYSLPDDQPDLLPFQWPIPDGMEVVTRDGRKVEQLTRFEGITDPIVGIIEGLSLISTWTWNGVYRLTMGNDPLDLFLRRKEKKVWVVEWPNNIRSIHDDFPVGVKDPDCTIYEATLQQFNQQS